MDHGLPSIYRTAHIFLDRRIINLSGMRRPHNESLLYLIDKFRNKECGMVRDRIFSLLAMAAI